MDVEEIKGNPGLQEKSPWNGSKKKNTPSSSVTSNRVTLTRFLGPSVPPSVAQWNDINRECPVCKRKGFSSRALEVHVNECLDNELRRGASNSVPREHPKLEASGKVQVEDVGRDRKASAVDFGPQKVTKVKRAPAVAERPNREDVVVNAPTEKSVDGAVALPKMRRKIRQAPKGAHGVQKEDSNPPDPGVACESLDSVCTTAKPPLARAKVASRSGSLRRSQIVGHRGAPSKAQNGALDATQAPVSIAADIVKRSDESVLGDTARAYFSFALGDDGRGVPNGANWIGTQLFPSPIREDDVIDSEEPCLRESLGGDVVDVGPTHSEESLNGANYRRVRRCPDSWRLRSFDEGEGWLGTWPRGECWDDGDGYLKLRPFPAPEGISGLDATQESGEEVQRTGNKFEKSSDHEDIAHLSRVDRVFRVFACLQPARQLDEELSVTSRPIKGGKRPRSDNASECHEMTKETTRARDLSPLRRMETNVVNEMGCVPRPKGAKDTKNPNECDDTNMGSDEEPTLGRISAQKATKVVDSSSCISTEREHPKIVADAAPLNEEARNAIEKSNAHSKSIGIKIRHAAPSSNKESPTSLLVASRQYHPSSSLGKGRHHGQASNYAIDLTSEASSPSKLGVKEVGESGGHNVKLSSNDTREGDKRSPHANGASAKGNAAPIGFDGATQSSRVKFPFSAQAATGAPRHVSPSGQHPTPSPLGLERRSTMEKNNSLTVGLQPPLCHASNSLPTESKVAPSQPRAPSTSNKTGPRPRGSLNLRASSGVMRNRDGREKGYKNPRVIPDSASTEHVIDTAYQTCGGRIAEVAQRGSLRVVDPDHGATLRSSWSIDHSEELGKIAFGTTLDYDAVWYYPRADEDCVDVLRYHIVPHPVLAPSGGWISERGRLRSDPYIIAKATPASIQRNSDPCRQREKGVSKMPWEENDDAPIRRTQGNGNPTGEAVYRTSSRAPGGNQSPASKSTSPLGIIVRSPKPDTSPQPLNSPRNSTRSKGGVTTVRFGFSTSPSAKELEENDTGDKVKCPVCHRGMDHWPQAQRNQHAHNCMLKKSSAAKGQPTTSQEHTRVIGSTEETKAFARRDNDVAKKSQLRGSRMSQQSAQCKPPQIKGGSPDAHRSPRQERVSLQGVFSTKARTAGLASGSDSFVEANPSRNAPETPSNLKPRAVSGPAVTRDRRRANQSVASESRSECPICRFSFAGRQGQWERDAHIQQCLESLTLDGTFDPNP